MTAPIPHGLFNVTSTLRVEPIFSDPSDIIFERLQTLRDFWKGSFFTQLSYEYHDLTGSVHNAQCRVSRNVGNIRSRQLFWRVWGDSRLSLQLKQSTLIQLWMRCQQDTDLSPFDLDLPSTWGKPEHAQQSPSTGTGHSRIQQSKPGRFDKSPNQLSITPTNITPTERILDDTNGHLDSSRRNRQASTSTQSTNLRPTPNRSTSNGSGGSGARKRMSVQAPNARGRLRPSIGRKRSSQSQQTSDAARMRSGTKSPRSSTDGSDIIKERGLARTLSPQGRPGADATLRSSGTISTCELPSASSWQSVDSHRESRGVFTGATSTDKTNTLAIDKNFREKFVENQKVLNSSTNLVGMSRIMRKTGSVVRFADEINVPEEIQQSRKLVKPSSSQARSKSEGQSESWRHNLERHDSVGSVAAVSDEESGDDEGDEDNLTMLPRVQSQLSLGVADLKRSQSMRENDTEFAVTSPEIEIEQEALIKGKKAKAPNEEEEKLLAMGRKDGVTRAGGINLPKELIVRGTFELSDDSDSSERPLY